MQHLHSQCHLRANSQREGISPHARIALGADELRHMNANYRAAYRLSVRQFHLSGIGFTRDLISKRLTLRELNVGDSMPLQSEIEQEVSGYFLAES